MIDNNLKRSVPAICLVSRGWIISSPFPWISYTRVHLNDESAKPDAEKYKGRIADSDRNLVGCMRIPSDIQRK
jgi:hypothetical protein